MPNEEEQLAPVDSLSDEEFDKAMEEMSNMPEPSEEIGDGIEDDEIVSDTEQSDEEVEQPEDAENDAEEEPDEEQPENNSTDETEDSTNEETEELKAGFDFSPMPMDELLPIEINANGMKMKATMNELVAGFQKGMNYTQKMQELSGVKKLVSIATSNDLSEEDLNLLVEAKSGNKEAIAKLLANSGVDPLDVDTDEHGSYVPNDYSKEEVDIEMSSVVDTINADSDMKPFVEQAIKNMPDDMYDTVKSSAGNLDSLYKDVKSGIYAKVMPEVTKLQNLYGKTEPTLDTYVKVARQMFDDDAAKNSVSAQESAEKKEVRSSKRKKVAPTSKAPTKKSFIKDDVKNLGEDDFEAEFARITGRSVNDYK